ncbi:MAG TPA: cytochrome c [Thermoanaerobaculia bacterium]|nr:cytochrome c [Thermoanaerobaculia bacterium]
MRAKTKEGLQLIAFLGLASLAAALPFSQSARPGEPQDQRESRAESGGRVYRAYCASCHGVSADGHGPMVEVLKVRPSDLTRISERNDGTFPEGRIAAIIDGRLEVRGHGPGSMPVWGLSFREIGRDSDQETEVRERIKDLVAYLESIQR